MKLFGKKKKTLDSTASNSSSQAARPEPRNKFMLNRITVPFIDALSIASAHLAPPNQQPLDPGLDVRGEWGVEQIRAFNQVIRNFVEQRCNTVTNGQATVPETAKVKRRMPYDSTPAQRAALRGVAFDLDRMTSSQTVQLMIAWRSEQTEQTETIETVMRYVVSQSQDIIDAVGYLENCFEQQDHNDPGATPGETSLQNRVQSDRFLEFCGTNLPAEHPYWRINKFQQVAPAAAPIPAAAQAQYDIIPRELIAQSEYEPFLAPLD